MTPGTKTIVFSGRSKSRDGAIASAEGALGKLCVAMTSRDFDSCWWGFDSLPGQKVRFEWLEGYQQVACEGLPTITLPIRFQFFTLKSPPAAASSGGAKARRAE
jgi:hypothetical protein